MKSPLSITQIHRDLCLTGFDGIRSAVYYPKQLPDGLHFTKIEMIFDRSAEALMILVSICSEPLKSLRIAYSAVGEFSLLTSVVDQRLTTACECSPRRPTFS